MKLYLAKSKKAPNSKERIYRLCFGTSKKSVAKSLAHQIGTDLEWVHENFKIKGIKPKWKHKKWKGTIPFEIQHQLVELLPIKLPMFNTATEEEIQP